MRDANKLSALAVAKTSKAGRYGDGRGLWLQVSPGGTKAWLFRFMLNGRARQMGLGPVDIVSLAEAREKARDCRKLLLDGVDPIEARKAKRTKARLEAARGMTFKQCAERLIASHEAGWRNAKHRQQCALMEAWSGYCTTPPATGATVVHLNKAKGDAA
jgi:hypothetical protein